MVGVCNLNLAPAVPLLFTGIRFVQRLRFRRIQFELRNESSGRLGIIRWSSLARSRDRGDCGGCRIEDRGIGAVEGTDETPRALRDCLLGLRPRSCRGERGSIHNI